MSWAFGDTVYWIALANPQDQWHPRARRATSALGGRKVITTEEVLTEFLAHFSGLGRVLRDRAIRYVDTLLNDPGVLVEHQSHQSFLDGLALYKARPDKGYSLTDCISMSVMHREKIFEVLTHDNHFAQEGFSLLL